MAFSTIQIGSKPLVNESKGIKKACCWVKWFEKEWFELLLILINLIKIKILFAGSHQWFCLSREATIFAYVMNASLSPFCKWIFIECFSDSSCESCSTFGSVILRIKATGQLIGWTYRKWLFSLNSWPQKGCPFGHKLKVSKP